MNAVHTSHFKRARLKWVGVVLLGERNTYLVKISCRLLELFNILSNVLTSHHHFYICHIEGDGKKEREGRGECMACLACHSERNVNALSEITVLKYWRTSQGKNMLHGLGCINDFHVLKSPLYYIFCRFDGFYDSKFW